MAIFDQHIDGPYEFTVEAMQTGRDYGHRDLCLFFDWQDPAHLSYLHFATEADPRSHHIQIVDAADRSPVTTSRTDGIDWGRDTWHTLRLVRNPDTGLIQGWFDGELVMEGHDTRFSGGRVGVGTFDDQGRFRNMVITARPAP